MLGEAEPALGRRVAPAGPGALRTSFFCSWSFHPQEKGDQGPARKGAARGQLLAIWICKEKGGGREFSQPPPSSWESGGAGMGVSGGEGLQPRLLITGA